MRWRGELEDINRRAEACERAEKRIAAGLDPGVDEEYLDDPESPEDVVTRSAPPWLVSMVIHLIALLVLALIASPAARKISRVIVEVGFNDQEAAAVELETVSLETEMPSDVEIVESMQPMEATDVPEIFDNVQPLQPSDLAPIEFGTQRLRVGKPMFNARTGAMKRAMLAVYGGTDETEAAVELGLQWLKRNQANNGSWSMRGPFTDGAITENKCAATAMALLAFLGDGNTHKSGPYAAEVDKGLKFLIGLQNRRTGMMADDARSHEKMYGQAQATIALCELYAMTKDSWLRPRAQLAVDFAEDSQSKSGGWRYRPREDSDTSVTGWFVMALQSALAAGLEVNESNLHAVHDYLDSAASFEGAGYSYQPYGDVSPAMTAEGLLCREYLGWPRDHAPLQAGLEGLVDIAMFEIEKPDVYYWYYATQVLHHYGGKPWKKWNSVMRVQLPAAQIKSGREAGSWPPQADPWARNSGRLYMTCLSIYCLEVYYRHMPLYKHQMTD